MSRRIWEVDMDGMIAHVEAETAKSAKWCAATQAHREAGYGRNIIDCAARMQVREIDRIEAAIFPSTLLYAPIRAALTTTDHPSDSDGSPKGGDGVAGSVRSTRARAVEGGI